MKSVIYLDLDHHVEVQYEKVRLSDVAKIYAQDKEMEKEARETLIYRFDGSQKRQVLSAVFLIRLLAGRFPEAVFQCIGEKDVLIERKEPSLHTPKVKAKDILKISAVCLISFFGAAFTIMAFHNDIGIRTFFQGIYYEFTGVKSDGFTELEISYSIGLALGILVFFNHLGKKRITDDPTPVEVAMKLYEEDINTALIELADRKGESR